MKNIYSLLFSLITVLAHAQESSKKAIYWGIELGIETQTLGIEPLDEKEPEETAVTSGRNKPGARIGIVGQKALWRGLSFESGLSVSTTHNNVNFRPGGRSRYQFTDIEVPFYFSITNQKNGGLPLRGKILLGPRFAWNIAQNPLENLQFTRERIAFDLGLGVEIRSGKWKISPEAIYSHGLNSIHNFTGTYFDYLVGRAVRDKVAFRIVLMRVK